MLARRRRDLRHNEGGSANLCLGSWLKQLVSLRQKHLCSWQSSYSCWWKCWPIPSNSFIEADDMHFIRRSMNPLDDGDWDSVAMLRNFKVVIKVSTDVWFLFLDKFRIVTCTKGAIVITNNLIKLIRLLNYNFIRLVKLVKHFQLVIKDSIQCVVF